MSISIYRIYGQIGESRLLTKEGVAACDEAIRFLVSAQPVPPIDIDIGLCIAAKGAHTFIPYKRAFLWLAKLSMWDVLCCANAEAVLACGPTGSTDVTSMSGLSSHGTLTGEIAELSKFGARNGR